MNLRFAIARTLSRPEYEDMSPINVLSIPDPKLPSTNANSRGTASWATLPQTRDGLELRFDRGYYAGNADRMSPACSTRWCRISSPRSPFITRRSGQARSCSTFAAQNISNARPTAPKSIQSAAQSVPGRVGRLWRAGKLHAGRKLHRSTDLRAFLCVSGSSKNNVNGTFYYDKGPLRHARVSGVRSDYLSALPWIASSISRPTPTAISR